jgi:site-specific DNA-cytosine methylase
VTPSIATLFSGGEGVGVGAQAAGLKHLWGIECDDGIAAVARANGFDVMTADVTLVDPAGFEKPTVLHASPPCPSFSTTNHERGETERDLALAEATCRFIEALKPPVFTLENVYLYRKADSFRVILKTLHNAGYQFDYWHLNAANYGVPQTRKRLFLVAARDFVPQKPPATHAALDEITPMFDRRRPWVGWYEAIADIVPDLPESEFAPWQKERLPDVIDETMMVAEQPNARGQCRRAGEPMKTVPAQPAGGLPRALLVDSAGWVDGEGRRMPVTRGADAPCNTVVANHGRRPMRAFVMSNANTEWGSGIRWGIDPMHTVTEQAKGRTRAFIVTGQTDWGDRGLQLRGSETPSFTVPANVKGDWRARVSGRVVQMVPRALARFQSFPDDYALPKNNALACRVIGNAVPPLFYRCVIESIKENL